MAAPAPSKSRKLVSAKSSRLATAVTSKATTIGNDEYKDDFEETEGEYQANSLEAKRKKLLIRPLKASKKLVICGIQNESRKETLGVDTSELDVGDKLSIRRKTELDLIKDQIEKPEGSVPPTALPTWYEIDMCRKIPLILGPENYIYYSRGKLGIPLHRCHPNYMIYDHLNHERVVNTPYNALHDPHVKNFLSNPNNRAFLIKQGLINEKNEVYCSFPEFNQFRSYLSTLFNDQVNNTVSSRDSCIKFQRDQRRLVNNYLSNDGGRQAFLNSRRTKAKTLYKQTRMNKMHKFETKQRHLEMQMSQWRETRAKENLMRLMAGYERDTMIKERLYQLRYQQLMIQRSYLKQSTMKDLECEERKKTDLTIMFRTQEQIKINWIDMKLEAGKKQLEREKMIEEALRQEHRENAKKRQKKVEWMRDTLPLQIEEKKIKEKALLELVRKFFMRWLDKVRRRLHAPKDLLHESVWIGKSKGVMDETLKYLKDISGYEKMDDFVLNIIKLKKQIQAQIELEEAEEAAALLEEERLNNPDHNAELEKPKDSVIAEEALPVEEVEE